MWSKDAKGKGKEAISGEGSSEGSVTLAWALETIGVTKYGFIGGRAISILSTEYGFEPRQTDDLDLIVQPTTTTSADLVSSSLTTNETLKGYIVSRREGYVDKPHVVVTRANGPIYIPIEIFDWQVWPNRQQYYNLDLEENAPRFLTVRDRQAPLLKPGWLLRQKILAYAQRQGKSLSDMLDIASLREMLALSGETITISDNDEVEALIAVLNSSSAPDLKGWIWCEAIWLTEWTWDAGH